MKVVLANGESVVKTWNYAISAKDAEKQKKKFAVGYIELCEGVSP